jgi:hypothetical protein
MFILIVYFILKATTASRKSTGIPSVSSTSSIPRSITPTQGIENPPKHSSSSNNLKILPSSV